MAPTRKWRQEPTRRSERVQTARAIEKSKEEAAPKGVVKHKRFRRPKQRKRCHLLNLPGELRNAIYRYTLVSPSEIRVRAEGPGEPALLRTCKAIQREARTLYYAENDFALQIVDYDGAAFTPFGRQYTRHGAHPCKPTNISFMLSGMANWDNLVRWIKDTYYGPPLLPKMDDPVTRSDYVVGGAFSIADAFEGGMCYAPWSMVEKALKAYHHGLKGTCSIWADPAGH